MQMFPAVLKLMILSAFAVSASSSHATATAEFSFIYDGTHAREALATWTSATTVRKLDRGRTETTVRYAVPNGTLDTTVITTTYADFPATHTLMTFSNRGTTDTAIIEDVYPMDERFAMPGTGATRLSYAVGSSESMRDFCPQETQLGTTEPVRLAPFGGRSSDGTMPFFNLRKPDGSGRAVCIGWSGQWAATVTPDGADAVRVTAGMEKTRFRLHPGETVRTPAVLTLSLPQGDEDSGFNRLRALLLRHFTPRRDGKLIEGPVCTSQNFSFEKQTADLHLKSVEEIRKHKLKSAFYFIDTGWSVSPTGNPTEAWARNIGNFTFEPTRYPNGVRPIADASHKTGRGFLLWFEPERVMPDTEVAREHNDWVITAPPHEAMPPRVRYMGDSGFGLFDLANDEARAWLIRKVNTMISEGDIDIYRHDFNMYPLYYWQKDEPEDRQGVHEMKYIAGLYEYFDALVREHPNLIIDSCASGGRRLDLEMISRAFALIRSDFLWDPVGQQCHTYGLNRWLPVTGVGAAGGNMYNARSGYGYNYILALNWTDMNAERWAFAKQTFDEVQAVKDLFCGDFHPLTPYSTEDTVWMAWQFHRADTDRGIVQAFRRKADTHARQTFKPTRLNPKTKYRVKIYTDKNIEKTMTGRALTERGLTFDLQPEQAAMATYRMIK